MAIILRPKSAKYIKSEKHDASLLTNVNIYARNVCMIKSKTHVEGVSIHLVTATKEKVHQPLTESPAFHQRRSRLITCATRISHAIMQRSW